jgi:hypothetical protein
MQTLDPTDAGQLRLAGILEAAPVPSGFYLHRLPAWARAQLLDPATTMMQAWPSGGRIDLMTDSTSIVVDALLTRVQIGDAEWPDPAFDLVIDGELVERRTATDATVIRIPDPTKPDIEVVPGEPVSLRFDGLAPSTKRVEVWLPHAAAVELRGIAVDDGADATAPPSDQRRWVHYGSSISHCIEALSPTGVWPVVAARRAGVDLQSFGFAGQCMLDQHVARSIRDLDADFISMKVGINIVNGDTFRERTFVPALHGFLDTVRDGHPTTPLLVITPIICPAAEDHPGPTSVNAEGDLIVFPRSPDLAFGALSIGRIRELIATVVRGRQDAGDTNLFLFDGRELFGENDVADLPDGLHPNAAGYERMGNRFYDFAFAPGGLVADVMARG